MIPMLDNGFGPIVDDYLSKLMYIVVLAIDKSVYHS
jgi:hypothetical protein